MAVKRPIKHADGCRCGGDSCKQRTPPDRRFFLRVVNRVEFEVTEAEYQQVMARALHFAFDVEEGPTNLSFHLGYIDGFFKDPKKEEVLVDAERP